MDNEKLKRRIAYEAARLMYQRKETDLYRAKIQAARQVCKDWIKPAEIPEDFEVREQVKILSRMESTSANETEENDRFRQYRALLLPLEGTEQNRTRHPEGDALYHSLQVFTLAVQEIPYDEEFLLAALLHDVGKAVDPKDHVAIGLELLGETITERTRWLIEHHPQAQQILEGTIGHRAKRRLQESEDFEELMTLARCDRDGRVPGMQVPSLEEALDYLRTLDGNDLVS